MAAKYGVHFVDEGYRTLATKCLECLKQLIRRAEGEPKKKGKPTVFCWRGFRSLRRSVRARTIPGMSSHDGGGVISGTWSRWGECCPRSVERNFGSLAVQTQGLPSVQKMVIGGNNLRSLFMCVEEQVFWNCPLTLMSRKNLYAK